MMIWSLDLSREMVLGISVRCFRNIKNDGEKITSLNWQASVHESKEDALAWQNSRAGLVAPVYVFELPFSRTEKGSSKT